MTPVTFTHESTTPEGLEALLKGQPKVGFHKSKFVRHPQQKANGAPYTYQRGDSYTRLELGGGFFAVLPIGKGGDAEAWGLPTFVESKKAAEAVAEEAPKHGK